MSLDQVVAADAEEILQGDEEEDSTYFQDIDILQNHGIVCLSFSTISVIL